MPRARATASELTRLASRGNIEQVVRSRPQLSRSFRTKVMSAGSSLERKSSTPSKPHSRIRANRASWADVIWVVHTSVFTPYFMLPLLVLGHSQRHNDKSQAANCARDCLVAFP